MLYATDVTFIWAVGGACVKKWKHQTKGDSAGAVQ
jgi:hypothetical protein